MKKVKEEVMDRLTGKPQPFMTLLFFNQEPRNHKSYRLDGQMTVQSLAKAAAGGGIIVNCMNMGPSNPIWMVQE
jgi:hypothetical protein